MAVEIYDPAAFVTCDICEHRKPTGEMVAQYYTDPNGITRMGYNNCKLCHDARLSRSYYRLISQPGPWNWGSCPLFSLVEVNGLLRDKYIQPGARFEKDGRAYVVGEWDDRLRLAEA